MVVVPEAIAPAAAAPAEAPMEAKLSAKAYDAFTVDSDAPVATEEEVEIKKAEEEYFEEEIEKRHREKKRVRLPWGFIATIIAMAILLGIVAFLFRFTEILGFGNRRDPEENSSESSQSEVIENNDYLISVPNFVGRMRNDVEGNSNYSDFVLVFEEANNNSYTEGMIFEQSVKYKTEVEKGTTITIKVSKGAEKIPMPNLVGMTLDEASAALVELGINFKAVPNFGAQYEYMKIYEQSVEAESLVTVGDRVNKIYIYYGAQEFPESSSSSSGWSGYDDPGYVNPGVTIIG